jgi:tight adherence protein B
MFGGFPIELVIYVLVIGSAAGVVWSGWLVGEAAFADYRRAYIAEASVTLGDVFSTFSPERVFQLSLIAAGAAFLVGFAAINVIAGGLFAVAAFFAPRMIFMIARDKRRSLFEMQLIDGLTLLANSLRAGMTLPQSMELLVREMRPPITQEFGRVLQENRLGTDFDQAMLNMSRRLQSRDLDMLVNAIAITRKSGGNMGEIFQKIAEIIRERARIEGKVKALSATGNMQAFVMSALPFALMGALYFIDPINVQLLFSTTFGLIAVGVTVFLVIVAFIWIRRIMDVDI